MKKVQAPATGYFVNFYRTACGNFAVNGYRGTSNDYMTQAYLEASDGRKYPSRIVVSPDVLEKYVHSIDLFPQPHNSTAEEVIRFVTARILGEFGAIDRAPLRFMNAVVELSRDMPYGTMLIYRGDEPVAELSGWL